MKNKFEEKWSINFLTGLPIKIRVDFTDVKDLHLYYTEKIDISGKFLVGSYQPLKNIFDSYESALVYCKNCWLFTRRK